MIFLRANFSCDKMCDFFRKNFGHFASHQFNFVVNFFLEISYNQY
jgi:hypothetical protein